MMMTIVITFIFIILSRRCHCVVEIIINVVMAALYVLFMVLLLVSGGKNCVTII